MKVVRKRNTIKTDAENLVSKQLSVIIELESQLEIATKALEDILENTSCASQQCENIAREALGKLND
jgi:hypothetical protein